MKDNLKVPHGVITEFCISCGACFPPRYGEGHCPNWEKCQKEQAELMRKMHPTNFIVRKLCDIAYKIVATLFVAFVILAMMTECSQSAEGPPHDSLKYRNDLIRNSRAIGGMGAPVALFAGQIQQESAWRPDVSSKYAHGLAQFTPDTAEWISGLFPELSANQPFNPSWAIRALVRYDYWLKERIRGDTESDRWAMVLSAYNGGLGWLYRDKRLAEAAGHNRNLWWDSVELYSSRADWAIRENRHYPRVIIGMWQFNYVVWGPTVPAP